MEQETIGRVLYVLDVISHDPTIPVWLVVFSLMLRSLYLGRRVRRLELRYQGLVARVIEQRAHFTSEIKAVKPKPRRRKR